MSGIPLGVVYFACLFAVLGVGFITMLIILNIIWYVGDLVRKLISRKQPTRVSQASAGNKRHTL